MSAASVGGGAGMETPAALIDTLIAARTAGYLAGAANCYDANATIVVQPGQVVSGEAAVAAFIAGSARLALTFTGRSIVVGDSVALHQATWSLVTPDGNTVIGCTADILRRRIDGTWRLALDNPWGNAIVEPI